MASVDQLFLLSSKIGPHQGRSPSQAHQQRDDKFSRANVFGLFLTIGLCLLVQPYGSLLYMKPQSVVGRIIFFFWPLNSLACIAEVFLLLIAMMDGMWTVLRSSSPPEEFRGFWDHMCTTAAAVQLIRRHGVIPGHWRTFVENDRGTTVSHNMPIVGVHTTHPAESPSRFEPVQTSGAAARPENELANNILSAGPDFANTSGAPPGAQTQRDSADLGNPQSADTNVPSGSPHNVTVSDIEAAGTQSEVSSATAGSAILGNAFLPISTGTPELILNLVSFAGFVVVMIKLISVVMPIHIRLSACFMVASWGITQAWHLVSKCHNPDRHDTIYIVRRTLELEATLHHISVWIILMLLLLSCFGYLTFVMVFETRTLPHRMKAAFI
jgi:hypothetical protein